ncbi:SIS domain-containing protein [Sporosarcina sp. E16_8]|uniref:sugar isomerase domain-containing protein n=1 Tax=Sporosarcina sp. E16_8 TaxID=2789295 RepID=UPI001A91605B|nr:SIS domain-containing protein [Sporosarcina sp. E16_8]MBO0587123.1 SIS domain-containing protein [Sporosarcina sp. E16_8]
MNEYFKEIESLMKKVICEEQQSVEEIAAEMTKRLSLGGIVQLFGSGHSHLIAEEPFFRAGGLVPVRPIIVESLMLHNGATQASTNEKDPEFTQTFAGQLDIRPEDVIIIISTSGRNVVPIDVANIAKESGAYVVSLQSLYYNAYEQPSKHHSGNRLEDVAEAVLNTHIPVGDGLLISEGMPYAPASGVIGNMLLHATFSRVIGMMIESGIEPPIFKSANLDGSSAHNEQMIATYGKRIKF